MVRLERTQAPTRPMSAGTRRPVSSLICSNNRVPIASSLYLYCERRLMDRLLVALIFDSLALPALVHARACVIFRRLIARVKVRSPS